MEVSIRDGIFVRAAGHARGRALLFVHAFADSSLSFAPLFDTPLAERFRLVGADLAGFGASPRRDDVLTIAQHADTIVRLAYSLSSHGPIGLVAHSVGSMIAVEAASQLGELFGGLFSIEGNLTADDAYFSGRAADFTDPDQFKTRFLNDLWSMAQTRPELRRYYSTVLLADSKAMWSLGCDARRLSLGAAPGQAYRQIHPARLYWSPANTAQGTRDWIEASGIDQQQFMDASHWPMVDRPQVTAQAIACFYENL